MTKQEEREFDEIFYMDSWGTHPVDKLALYKSFISNLTKKREIKLIEEVERLIEGMRKDSKHEKYCKHCGEEIGYDRGAKQYFCGTCPFTASENKKDLVKPVKEYNQALSDLEENLKKLKGK